MKRRDFKKIYLVLIAISAGFAAAFITAGVHSLFFTLLPIMAFGLGAFSSWGWGMLNGFLVFLSYTFTLSLMWTGGGPNLVYPLPYIAAFVTGGFSLPVIGALASAVRKGAGKAVSIIALMVLVIVTGWCGYSAVTQYGYYYQVAVTSTEDLKNLELYLPVGAVTGVPYRDLYRQPFRAAPPGALTGNFTQELVDTEYGTMLKLAIPDLHKDDVPEPRYTANIIFWQKSAPRQLIQLMPRKDVVPVNTVSWQQSFGPVKTAESRVIERFQVPVKITADKPAQVKLTCWNRTDRGEAVNFAYSRSDPYTERINQDMQTGDEWTFVPVEATSVMRISGISD
ncbi:MAG: hypothetical protein PHR43_05375 [Dehalococcoidales bacterium]|nr:hypothetical protein [Dehalococcoidales bacterium]